MAEHAKLSPSSSDRWLNCPASIFRAPEVSEDEGSEAAHEGTAAHAFAEFCLKRNLNGLTAPFPQEYAKYDTPDLRMHIQTYLEYVMRIVVDEEGELFVEQRLEIFRQFEVFGTADAIVVTKSGVIHVIDLKYGKGILVSVEDNTQLLLYGVGGMAFDWLSTEPVHSIAVHIVQPRRSNLVSQVYSVSDLATWVDSNLPAVKRAFDGTNEATAGTHCKWCPIKGSCPERAQANLELAVFDFDDTPPTPVTLDTLSEDRLVTIFLSIKQFRDWLDDVEAEMAKRAHDHPIDRLKWVSGRKTRKVTDEEMAATLLRDAGLEPYQPAKLLGITEIETQLKLKGLKLADVLGAIVQQFPGKNALVAATDKREAITPVAGAIEDFS